MDKAPQVQMRYFETFAGYAIPFHPSKELNEAEAKSRTQYYTAEYDPNGHIIKFTKIQNNAVVFEDTYYYNGDGALEKRRLRKQTGEIVEQPFDKNGKLVY